jgi:hypothetical protein
MQHALRQPLISVSSPVEYLLRDFFEHALAGRVFDRSEDELTVAWRGFYNIAHAQAKRLQDRGR